MADQLPDVVICGKCSQFTTLEDARRSGWLVSRAVDGSFRLIMRCPDCQTAHARRLAGLPGRVSVKRVEHLLASGDGLSFYADGGVNWYANRWTDDLGVKRFFLQRLWGTGIPESETEEFDDLPALVLAMSAVADLRRWFRTGTRLLPGE